MTDAKTSTYISKKISPRLKFTKLSLLASSLRSLTLRMAKESSLNVLIVMELPEFKALTTLKLEIVKHEIHKDSLVASSNSWVKLLNKMITGENGKPVKGIIIEGYRPPESCANLTFMWEVEKLETKEDGGKKGGARGNGLGVRRGKVLSIKRVSNTEITWH